MSAAGAGRFAISAHQWRQIVNSAVETAIIGVDRDGRVTRWNEGARRIFGWTEDEMLGHTVARLFPKDLGEDEDWLWDISIEMEIEDGVIWVYGVGEDGVQAFTDFGIENLIELIRFYKENPGLLRR